MGPILIKIVLLFKKFFPWILMLHGIAVILIIWQETNLLAQPPKEDRWRTKMGLGF